MSRKFRFVFEVECASSGKADQPRVEELLDLALKDLIYDDEFIVALDEKESVTIQLIPLTGSLANQNQNNG
jgi:hypothetical protein